MATDFDTETSTAAGVIRYKVNKFAKTDERYSRAGVFGYDFLYNDVLRKLFSREVVSIAAQKAVSQGTLERVYVASCSKCGTENMLVEEDEQGRSSKRLLEEGCVGCEFCGNALPSAGSRMMYTIHHRFRPSDSIYFSIDRQENDFYDLTKPYGKLTLFGKILSLLKKIFGVSDEKERQG